jgi:hypothetical protein
MLNAVRAATLTSLMIVVTVGVCKLNSSAAAVRSSIDGICISWKVIGLDAELSVVDV